LYFVGGSAVPFFYGLSGCARGLAGVGFLRRALAGFLLVAFPSLFLVRFT